MAAAHLLKEQGGALGSHGGGSGWWFPGGPCVSFVLMYLSASLR